MYVDTQERNLLFLWRFLGDQILNLFNYVKYITNRVDDKQGDNI